MYQRALKGYENAPGPEHTSTLTTVGNLAALYTEQGKMHEAESMYRRALEVKEKTWGPEHTSTVYTVKKTAWSVFSSRQDTRSRVHVLADAGRQKEAWGIRTKFGQKHRQ